MKIQYVWRAAFASLLCVFATVPARAVETAGNPGELREGQQVEVREGDTWSRAGVVKHEGRKYLIHYADADASADEWVTIDRIRTNASASQPAATTGGVAPRPHAPKLPGFEIGQKTEFKWGGLWKKGVVTNRRGEWYFITDEHGWREWVEPWRLRAVGSTADDIGYAQPNGMVHKGEGPPQPVPGPAPLPFGVRRNADGTAADPVSDLTVTPTDHSAAKAVSLVGAPPVSLLASDAAARPPKPLTRKPIVLAGATMEFFDNPEALLMSSPETSVAAVMHRDGRPGRAAQIRIERVDLAAGQSMGTCELSTHDIEAIGLSSDAKLFVDRTGLNDPTHSCRVDVWELADTANARLVASMLPFDEHVQKWGENKLEWGAFVDTDHLLLLSSGGRLALFNFRKPAEVWSTGVKANTRAAVSANGKFAAVYADDGIVVIETATGRAVGRIDDRHSGTLSFSPDGTRLACASGVRLAVWDLHSGKLVGESSSLMLGETELDWLPDGNMLLGGARVVSPARHAALWTYNGPAIFGRRLGQMLDGRYWYVLKEQGRQNKPVLASTVLPDESVDAVLAVVGEPRMFVKPGTSVSLEVSVDGAIADKVTALLTAKLRENGVTVADNQPIKLVARTEPGDTQEVSYRRIGAGPFAPPDKISVQGVKYSVSFTDADGKAIWDYSSKTGAPLFLMMKQGQTVEEAVAEQTAPRASFFENVEIPKFVERNRKGFGTSTLNGSAPKIDKPTPQGV